ncbi:MAG TPA: AlwI family type II restriction endonuclease [Firmicutes bacterium]|nr:AlwI family type II restriction endonuclease [Bacillota bacterium]
MSKRLNGKTLFFTTSPRSPLKMIPEISLLADNFSGKIWNKNTQTAFIELLAKDPNFEGEGFNGDLAFSARDRINRAPKSLGFINLNPNIQLTEVGKLFVLNKRKEEILLRQLLKFQLPSPYHIQGENNTFWVKPYLEILRLIKQLETITFDEMCIFAMQLTDFHKFDLIVNKILAFRNEKEHNAGNYKRFYRSIVIRELREIYAEEIANNRLETRESTDNTLQKFINTKRSNLRDYTDACFRYLRATGLVAISHKGRSISIMPDKIADVDYILSNIDRTPVFVENMVAYKNYLFNSCVPKLYTDNKDNLIDYILRHSEKTRNQVECLDVEQLKDLRDDIIDENKNSIVQAQIKKLKSYSLYNEVIDTYNEIISDELYDIPLMLEWNTWRAMTMLDGGCITGNFKIDDAGQPLSTASGNVADIVCDYGEFGLTVEVTMQNGQRQYETEGEPVARHLAKYKKTANKEAFCLFIAPQINEACVAHFYTLTKTNISYYGGKSIIVPLPLEVFMKMVENSYSAKFVPTPEHIKGLFDFAKNSAEKSMDEKQWFNAVQEKALTWLSA